MVDLIFIVKSLAITFVLVLLLQIKVGETTLEERTMGFVRTSAVVAPLQEVASGAVKVIQQTWNKTLGKVNSKFFKSVGSKKPGSRADKLFNMERSKEYLSEKADQVKGEMQRHSEVSRERLKDYLDLEKEEVLGEDRSSL